MPVLHKYKNKTAYYVLTMIGKTVATFHLKSQGYRKLSSMGIKKGDTFPRALLLDLYRTGDAYIHASDARRDAARQSPGQLKLDFADDPVPASLFPSCACCASCEDLHVVELRQPEHIASILCASCRQDKRYDACIPLALVTGDLLAMLVKIKGIHRIDRSVLAYQKLLGTEFENRWGEVKKTAQTRQRKLFDPDGPRVIHPPPAPKT